MKFTSDELQNIRNSAEENAESVVNVYWKRAYNDLAEAADRLHAMEARTEDG